MEPDRFYVLNADGLWELGAAEAKRVGLIMVDWEARGRERLAELGVVLDPDPHVTYSTGTGPAEAHSIGLRESFRQTNSIGLAKPTNDLLKARHLKKSRRLR